MESLSRVFNNFPVKIHAHQQDDIITALKIIEEFGLNATIEHCTEGHFIANILAKKNQRCVIGPNMTKKSKVETKNRTFNIGKILDDAGVEFSIMTDHPVVPIQHALTQAAIFIGHGMEFEKVLRCITINAAKSVGIDNRIGSIEAGKEADIVIWSGDPFHYMTKASTILVGGKIVKLNGKIIE
ncbi:MAG: amidohydrolase family protein [Fusobacteriaceae bacterium]